MFSKWTAPLLSLSLFPPLSMSLCVSVSLSVPVSLVLCPSVCPLSFSLSLCQSALVLSLSLSMWRYLPRRFIWIVVYLSDQSGPRRRRWVITGSLKLHYPALFPSPRRFLSIRLSIFPRLRQDPCLVHPDSAETLKRSGVITTFLAEKSNAFSLSLSLSLVVSLSLALSLSLSLSLALSLSLSLSPLPPSLSLPPSQPCWSVETNVSSEKCFSIESRSACATSIGQWFCFIQEIVTWIVDFSNIIFRLVFGFFWNAAVWVLVMFAEALIDRPVNGQAFCVTWRYLLWEQVRG